ncbi:MAG TPA: glycosyltransferase family 87 protein, partial [Pirellulales bacterium]|nr:glycosyltransferase family 87 protein [Pirellulales bacterium]
LPAMSIAQNIEPADRSSRRLLNVAGALLFLIVLTGVSWRLHEHWPLGGPASTERWALASFRDAIYYPLLAVRDGVNPYDSARNDDPLRYMQRYPVGDTLPLYSPLILLAFAPFAWLSVDAGMLVFTVLNVGLMLLLTWSALRAVGRRPTIAAVCAFTALLLASQPGRGAINSGQTVLPLALAAFAALHWGDRRPWTSAACLAFTTFKITYGGPLVLLLAARRQWRTAVGGVVLGGLLGGLGLLVIAARSGDLSVQRMTAVLVRNQADFNADPTVIPENNRARIDLVAASEYLVNRPLPPWAAPLAALLVLGVSSAVLWRLPARDDAAESAVSTSSAMAVLAMFICIYHNVYDLPLLVVPIAACATAAHPSWRNMTRLRRRLVFGLMLLPFVNTLWTNGFRTLLAQAGINWGPTSVYASMYASDLVYRLCCAANGLALSGAWLMLATSALRIRPALPQPLCIPDEPGSAVESPHVLASHP